MYSLSFIFSEPFKAHENSISFKSRIKPIYMNVGLLFADSFRIN